VSARRATPVAPAKSSGAMEADPEYPVSSMRRGLERITSRWARKLNYFLYWECEQTSRRFQQLITIKLNSFDCP